MAAPTITAGRAQGERSGDERAQTREQRARAREGRQDVDQHRFRRGASRSLIADAPAFGD
jgi:hypothetical protein